MSKIDVKKLETALGGVADDVDVVGTGNTFKFAYAALKAGYAVRRAAWLGYWVAEGQNVKMHCKDGRVFFMEEGCIPMFTLANTIANDWVILDEDHRKELDKLHAAKLLAPAANQAKAEKILKRSRKGAK